MRNIDNSTNLAYSFERVGVETEIWSSFVRASLHKWFHVWDPNEPEPMFFVIKPASIITNKNTKYKILVTDLREKPNQI